MLRIVIEHMWDCHPCTYWRKVCFISEPAICSELRESFLYSSGKQIEEGYTHVIVTREPRIKVEAIIALFRMKYPLCVAKIQLIESKKHD